MPTHEKAMSKLKQQSTSEMPIVRVDELSKGPGDTVQVDCAHVVKLRAVMGDRNAEGMGPSLKYSSQDIRLDMATLPVSAGGKIHKQGQRRQADGNQGPELHRASHLTTKMLGRRIRLGDGDIRRQRAASRRRSLMNASPAITASFSASCASRSGRSSWFIIVAKRRSMLPPRSWAGNWRVLNS